MTTYPFPGYVANVTPNGGRIESNWAEAIRDRGFQVFATTSALVAGIASPQDGQVALIVFDGANSGMWVHSAGAWRPGAWNSALGEITRTVDTTLQSNANNTENIITAAATPFTAQNNRRYRITVSGCWRNLAATAQNITIKVKDGTTLIEQARNPVVPSNNTGDCALTFSVETTALTAGSHTINVTQQNAGSASGVSNLASGTPLVVTVDDMGPAGAPA